MAKTAANTILPLPSLVRAMAWDAGNESMRKAGREVWSRADYNAAARKQNELVESVFGEGDEGFIKFSIAGGLEEQGYLRLDMRSKNFHGMINAVYEAG